MEQSFVGVKTIQAKKLSNILFIFLYELSGYPTLIALFITQVVIALLMCLLNDLSTINHNVKHFPLRQLRNSTRTHEQTGQTDIIMLSPC